MAKKNDTTVAPSVAVNVPTTEQRYPDGVPLSVPSAPEQTGSGQSGQTKAATTKKEN